MEGLVPRLLALESAGLGLHYFHFGSRMHEVCFGFADCLGSFLIC